MKMVHREGPAVAYDYVFKALILVLPGLKTTGLCPSQSTCLPFLILSVNVGLISFVDR